MVESTDTFEIQLAAPSRFIRRDEDYGTLNLDGHDIESSGRTAYRAERLSYAEAIDCFTGFDLRFIHAWPDDLCESTELLAKELTPFGNRLAEWNVKLENTGRGNRDIILNVRSLVDCNANRPHRQQVRLGTVRFDKWHVNAHYVPSGIAAQDKVAQSVASWIDNGIEEARGNFTTNAKFVNRLATRIGNSPFGCSPLSSGRTLFFKFPAGVTDKYQYCLWLQGELIEWLPCDWTVTGRYTKASVSDLTESIKQAHSMLDEIEAKVSSIDNHGYKIKEDEHDYYARRFEDRMESAADMLHRVAAHRQDLAELAERLDSTHDRMVQVIDNGRSVVSGTTAHLFD